MWEKGQMHHSLEERLSAQTHVGRFLERFFVEHPSDRMARIRAEWLECPSETAGELADRLQREQEEHRG
jgi:hypothetical protein